MDLKLCLVFSLCFYFIVHASEVSVIKNQDEEDTFPEDFSFGVATAAYQIEGGWNADGKGPSIWDTFTHEHPEMIADGSNGDVGADSYHLFDLDLQALKDLGVNHYRFSISWSRVLPNGDRSFINKYGIRYYNDVINKLIENGITPMVTMHHNDPPEVLQKLGGFANPLVVKYFEEYADVLYSHFGDRVKTWITFNAPYEFCVLGYGYAYLPPMANTPGIAEYLCMHHILKAHALAYRRYKNNYAAEQKGKIGITLSSGFFYSKHNNTDLENRAQQFRVGWAANPLFSSTGGYPEVMIDDIESNSLREGRKQSRLPNLEGHLKEVIRGSSDFLGLNYYTSAYVEWANPPEGANPSIDRDTKLKYHVDPNWIRAKSATLYSVPEGLADLLRWIKDNYNNVEVIVTENGWSDDGELNDDGRIAYLKAHLSSVLGAIKSGCNVSGYTFWSLLDNFEWTRGYTEKFGLYSVNLSSPHKERTAKKSAAVYKAIIKERKLLL